LIAARRGHFTAADLITDADTRDVKVGRATVFRTVLARGTAMLRRRQAVATST
jgi:Fe2+ or Zn2+ uptake regulation protein